MTTLRFGWLGLVAALLGGCSGFERDFKALSAVPAPAGQIEGAWIGSWRSDTSDHSGPLKAIVTRTGKNEYQVRYRAVWSSWMPPFQMETLIKGHFAGSTFHFQGDANLGWPWGRYDYAGYATGEEFFSTYKAQKDRGIYSLRRPTVRVAPESPPATNSEEQGAEFGVLAIEALGGSASPEAETGPDYRSE